MTHRPSTRPRGPAAPGIDPGRVRDLLGRLRQRHRSANPISARTHERAQQRLPGGNTRTPVHFEPFPVYVDAGHGARIVDVDGHRYLDLVNNFASLVHGHRFPPVVEALDAALRRGWAFGAPTSLELELADHLRERVASLSSVRFTNSGTEAMLYAVRTARGVTGRRVVAKAEGGYHGGAESLQAGVRAPAVGRGEGAEAGAGPVADTVVVPFNDVDRTVALLRAVGSELAAVVLEPVQNGAGALPATAEFVHAVAEVTAELGGLLILDEVMTLRLEHGGVQERLDVTPDLTGLGKIIGGGLPVGAFGGRDEVMAFWDPRGDGGYHAGTFNANALTAVAGLAALRALTREAVAALNRRGDQLRARVATVFADAGLPLCVSGYGSVAQVHEGTVVPTTFADAHARGRDLVRCLHLALLEQGVFIAPRGSLCLSTPVDDADVDLAVRAFAAASGELAERLR